MFDPENNRFEPLTPELKERLAVTSVDDMTPRERVQREWTQFHEGEVLVIKGISFRVHEIGETRMVLKPFKG